MTKTRPNHHLVVENIFYMTVGSAGAAMINKGGEKRGCLVNLVLALYLVRGHRQQTKTYKPRTSCLLRNDSVSNQKDGQTGLAFQMGGRVHYKPDLRVTQTLCQLFHRRALPWSRPLDRRQDTFAVLCCVGEQ